MKKNLKHSESILDKMQLTEPLHPRSEKDFLAQKAMITKLALVKTTRDMAMKLFEAVDVRDWIQKYPFQSTGTAAVVGFVMAGALTSSTSSQTPHSSETKTSPLQTKEISSMGSTLFSMILGAGVDLLKEVLTPLIRENFQPKPHEKAGSSSPSSPDCQ